METTVEYVITHVAKVKHVMVGHVKLIHQLLICAMDPENILNPNNPNHSAASSSGIDSGGIIGIAVGGGAIVLIIVGVIIFKWKTRRTISAKQPSMAELA